MADMLAMSKWLKLLVAAGLPVLCGAVDLTGEWVMNPSKSSYKPKPQPQGETYSIEHKAPSVKVRFRTVWPDGPSSGVFAYMVDGKEISGTKRLDNGREANVTESVQWDGAVLVVKRKIKFAELPSIITVETERWSLSADNRLLTVTTEMTTENKDGKTMFKVVEHPTIIYDRVR